MNSDEDVRQKTGSTHGMTDRERDAGELSPRDAVERYLRRRRADATDSSIRGWKYRLKLFVDTRHGEERWIDRMRVGEKAVREAVRQHIRDLLAGEAGVFRRRCSPP